MTCLCISEHELASFFPLEMMKYMRSAIYNPYPKSSILKE